MRKPVQFTLSLIGIMAFAPWIPPVFLDALQVGRLEPVVGLLALTAIVAIAANKMIDSLKQL